MNHSKHKHQFSKLDVEFKDGDITSIVTKSERYRELLAMLINSRIETLAKTLEGDFDKRNYGLSRAHKDGGIRQLTLLKEIIEDV